MRVWSVSRIDARSRSLPNRSASSAMSGSGTLMNWCTNSVTAWAKVASAGERAPCSTRSLSPLAG